MPVDTTLPSCSIRNLQSSNASYVKPSLGQYSLTTFRSISVADVTPALYLLLTLRQRQDYYKLKKKLNVEWNIALLSDPLPLTEHLEKPLFKNTTRFKINWYFCQLLLLLQSLSLRGKGSFWGHLIYYKQNNHWKKQSFSISCVSVGFRVTGEDAILASQCFLL